MAELNRNYLANFTAATSAVVLIQSLRFFRNFRYYNNISENSVHRNIILYKVREARQLAFTLHNLMSEAESIAAPFYVSVAFEINDRLEEIHRKLLFYNAGEIIEMIPLVDKLRRYFRDFKKVEFYDDELIECLDSEIPELLMNLENEIKFLSQSISI